MSVIRNKFKSLVRVIDQKIYNNRNFVVVSNNCWGAEIYKQLNKPYNTPFVGLFMHGPDYLKLLQNFDVYLGFKLQFVNKSKWTTVDLEYPVALLNDLEIHFMHYEDQEEAQDKWVRRLERMRKIRDKKQYYFKICDRDGADEKTISLFHKLPFKNKLSFGVANLSFENHITICSKINKTRVPSGIKLYKASYNYLDVLAWVNGGGKYLNFYSKLKFLLKLV